MIKPLENIIRSIASGTRPHSIEISDIREEEITMKLFSDMYTLIAKDYVKKNSKGAK